MNKRLLSFLLSGLLMSSAVVFPVDKPTTSWKSSVVRGVRDLALASSLLVLKAKCSKSGLDLGGDAGSAVVCFLSFVLFISGTDHLIRACE